MLDDRFKSPDIHYHQPSVQCLLFVPVIECKSKSRVAQISFQTLNDVASRPNKSERWSQGYGSFKMASGELML